MAELVGADSTPGLWQSSLGRISRRFLQPRQICVGLPPITPTPRQGRTYVSATRPKHPHIKWELLENRPCHTLGALQRVSSAGHKQEAG